MHFSNVSNFKEKRKEIIFVDLLFFQFPRTGISLLHRMLLVIKLLKLRAPDKLTVNASPRQF